MTPSMFARAAAALLCLFAALPPAFAADEARWVAAWSAAPDSPGPALEAQTLRQFVRSSAAGSQVRVRLSNLFGSLPVTIGPVHIAARGAGSTIQAGSDHALTFSGAASVTIAPGASVLSDAADMRVGALEELAVSIYLPARTGASTVHGTGVSTAYLTVSGDAVAAVDFPDGEYSTSRYFLTDVEVLGGPMAQTLVAFGDSITDGIGSSQDKNLRWPDQLAARLQARPELAHIAVADVGISGNRILHDGADPFIGPSAQARFDRDALSKPGVRWILLLEGGNDIAGGSMLTTADDNVSAAQIIEGMQSLIARAHAKGVRIWGATLLPFGGAEWPYHSAAGEVKRQQVNRWIRSAGAFDAVLDFEQAVRDPAHPDRLLPAFDSGDHLHPNDAGHKALADAVDARLFAQ